MMDGMVVEIIVLAVAVTLLIGWIFVMAFVCHKPEYEGGADLPGLGDALLSLLVMVAFVVSLFGLSAIVAAAVRLAIRATAFLG